MGFVVYRPGGVKDAEFEAYARLLRQQGKDIARLPRVPEPGSDRRYLYVWPTEKEAERFAKEMRRRTGDQGWEVAPVNGQFPEPSEGPIGPLTVQLFRDSTGLTFSLHPLSRAIVKSLFPRAGGATNVFIDASTWKDYQREGRDLSSFVREIVYTLSGLKDEELAQVGYDVVDALTRNVVFSGPAILASS